MTFAFNIALPVQPKSTIASPLDNLNTLTQKDLEERGMVLSSEQMKNEFLFTPMGGWNVTFRSSVIRVRAARALPWPFFVV
tara:strand:- start:1167 stop:1409 length:243 start_codon:yes stop_codon:yes gene_type:complete